MVDTTDGANASGEASGSNLTHVMDQVAGRTQSLESGANSFARAMTGAFSRAAAGGKQFDGVLKSLALRLSGMAVRAAFRPLTQSIGRGAGGLFGGAGLGGSGTLSSEDESLLADMGDVQPFAAGGVIAAPTYFPMGAGGVGLAGEAGPEAILPLARGPDGRLGVAASSRAGGANVSITINTPDAQGFRRSEAYVTGLIARAVSRGQRSL